MSTLRQNGAVHPHVETWLTHLKHLGHPATTIYTYRCALRVAERELPAGLLSLGDEIQAWLSGLRSPSTRVVYRAALRGFYSWAHQRQLITANPAADLPPVKRRRGLPRPCTLEELAIILDRARQPVALWAVCAAYAGARCIEIARLDRTHITQETTYLHGKGDAERVVPTHPALWAEVCDLPAGLVGGGRTAHTISNMAAAECDRIGLPQVTLHRLRHLAGTLWQQATGDIRVTQELLGHASVATTQVYTAVSDAHMRAAVLALPSLTATAGETRASALPLGPPEPRSGAAGLGSDVTRTRPSRPRRFGCPPAASAPPTGAPG